MEKQCTRCKQTKSVKDFNNSRYRKEGTRAHCKTCEREQARDFYHKNSDIYKKRARVYGKRLRAHLFEFTNQLKVERGCAFCHERTLCVLDFHHYIKGRPIGWSGHTYLCMEKELAKCVVSCANCHRKVHAGLLQVDPADLCKVKVPRLPRQNVDRKAIARNKSNVRKITFNGKTLALVEWAENIGMDQRTLSQRLACGWSVEKALTTPKGNYSRK